jgi:Tfp pilus assembly protein FimT
LAVVVVLAMAAVGSQMLAPSRAARSMEASGESRKLIAALRSARSTAIARQTPVRVRLLGTAQQVTGYVIEQQVGSVYTAVAPNENFDTLASATTNQLNVQFAPTGTANNSLRLVLSNGRQTHTIQVLSATGQVTYVRR